MLRLLERDCHGQRLRDLLARFRAQELTLTSRLQDLQAELERLHRDASVRTIDGPDGHARLLAACTDMQTDCDLLATELVHVRMAVAGAIEEVTEHDRNRFLAAHETLGTTA